MTILEYQQAALTTAVYPSEWKILYPATGLCEETGEVAGKFKRIIRDSHGEITEETKRAIALELGDCMWYLCVLAHDAGIKIPKSIKKVDYSNENEFKQVLRKVIRLNNDACNLASVITIPGAPKMMHNTLFFRCFHLVQHIAFFIGYTFDDVMKMNIEKLQNRVKNNTIHGSGDNR